MLEKIAEWVCILLFLPHIRKAERKIGYKLVFRDIPERFINGIVPWDMTTIWRQFGLNIEVGANYWTIGHIMNGISTRYDRNSPEYQAWLGGYTVKLPPGNTWRAEDHLQLAIADQNSWLRTYGDPNPLTSVEGCKFFAKGPIQSGKFSGILYETEGLTHSDMGQGRQSLKAFLSHFVKAAFLNLSNPNLNIRANMLVSRNPENQYETLKLRAYFAIFDLGENVHAILYGNGALIPERSGEIRDTFPLLEKDFLRAMRGCEIVEI